MQRDQWGALDPCEEGGHGLHPEAGGKHECEDRDSGGGLCLGEVLKREADEEAVRLRRQRTQDDREQVAKERADLHHNEL